LSPYEDLQETPVASYFPLSSSWTKMLPALLSTQWCECCALHQISRLCWAGCGHFGSI